jgi:hypothetical protein
MMLFFFFLAILLFFLVFGGMFASFRSGIAHLPLCHLSPEFSHPIIFFNSRMCDAPQVQETHRLVVDAVEHATAR